MCTNPLLSPVRLGAIDIPNRIVMAPMTRMRAGEGNAPTALNAEYYAQRATAGLIITEGTAICPEGQGYPNAPGIYTAQQIEAWRSIADAVHARGGRAVMQIAHNGRNSHSSLIGSLPVAPSAVATTIPALTRDFRQVPSEVPRGLRIDEIPGIVKAFRQAARNAIDAGFDGVELQGANGHLIEQFLETGTNQRNDIYGGTKENRARFLFEIVDQVAAEIGANRLGVRLSPFGQYGGIHDDDPEQLFRFVIEQLSARHIAYLHLIEARGSEIGLSDELHSNAVNNAELFRRSFDGPLISAAAYTPQTAAAAIEHKHADAVAFGRLFLANPDLVERIGQRKPLNAPDRATFYGGGEPGYTDYFYSQDIAPTLIGTWNLISYTEVRRDQEDGHPFGDEPEGYLIYSAEGYVSAHLMKPESSIDQIAYSGRFEVDEQHRTVTHIPSVALIPSWIGSNQVRLVELGGDRLTLRVAGEVVSRLEWRRV